MSLEERLNLARTEFNKKVEQLNQLEQSKNILTQEIVRLDERVRLLTELIKEQNSK